MSGEERSTEVATSQWDRWVRDTIADVGWAVVTVSGETPYAFTIGVWHSFGRPELAMFGLREPDMQIWLNNSVRLLREGPEPPPDGAPIDGVLDRFPVQTRGIDPSWHRALFGAMCGYYGSVDMPVRQVVWPDREGRWPWDPAATATCRERQPQAWVPVDAHPEGAWRLVGELSADWPFQQLEPDATVMASPEVLAGTMPIVAVTHDADDAWDFLDERGYVDDATGWVFFGELYKSQPWLARFADLAADRQAWLDSDGEWHVRRFSEALDEATAAAEPREAAAQSWEAAAQPREAAGEPAQPT
ncbi:MAG: hypothetical protein QOE03_1701 [Micromonosporaceae bacterium]|nr:hypothetical protein [Micromonosporaceae bacterium]